MRKRLCVAAGTVALACLATSASAGTSTWLIKTVAGNGRGEFSGDGGPAIKAGITPIDVAVDGRGNVYVADVQPDSGRVRRIGRDGRITTFAGGGSGSRVGGDAALAAKSAHLAGLVTAVAASKKGDVYVAENDEVAYVWKIGIDGVIRLVAGGGLSNADSDPATRMLLRNASGLALDSRGDLYISTGNAVLKVTPDGAATTVAGSRALDAGYAGDGGPATQARLDSPAGLAVDGRGNLFIADIGNRRLRRVTPDGTITTFARGSSAAVAVDKEDNVYFANGGFCAVPRGDKGCFLRRFSPDGKSSTVIAGGGSSLKDGPARAASWGGFNNLAVDAHGTIFVVFPGLGLVRMVYRAHAAKK